MSRNYKSGLLLVFLLSFSIPAAAQNFTSVSGTITDSSGLPYSFARVDAQIVPGGTNPSVPPPCSGQTSTNCAIAGFTTATADVNGNFTMTLGNNAVIIPGSTQWRFTASTPGAPPPMGTGPQICNATLTISGASQSITSSFSSCPALSRSSGGGTVGGTFGASPSTGYTFTSTPITTAPFQGNLLIGTVINETDVNTYVPGAGWTIALASGGTIGIEYQTAGAASSYTAAFTQSSSQVWGGTISAFTATNPALVQATQSGSNHNSLAYSSNNTAGDLLFAIFRFSTGSTGPITAVTDTRGNTWHLIGLRAPESAIKGASTTSAFQEIWYAANCAGGANTVTATGITGATAEVAVSEWSGVKTTNPLVDYNYNPDGTGNTASTSVSGATTNSQFLYQAVNNVTGVMEFSGRDHAVVFNSAAANLASTGGQLFHKKGIYNGQSSIQETNNGQTNWYVFALPPTASGGVTQVYWDLVGETGTQASSTNQFGTIFNVLPSAYSGPAPSGALLSALWQRPAPSAVNNSVIFRNMTCRIPDNQRSPTACFDSFQSQFSSHINTVAETAIGYVDQVCSGLTPAVANMTGYRTNQVSTNEAYFENTWSIGWNAPYNVLSNHPIGINMHSLCNQNAGLFNIGATDYGGILIHFQDNHNIVGPIFTCTLGGRYDLLNTIVEVTTSGAFARTNGATETTPGTCTGQVTVSTAAANGVGFAPGSFWSAGHGLNFRTNESMRLVQPGLLFSSFTSAATTGTTKQTLATYTFPYNNSTQVNAGPFQNNGGAVFEEVAWGITAANADSKTFEIDFGGTAVATITSTVNAGTIRCKARIIVSSVANTQEVIGECDDGTTRTVTRTAPAITGNATIVTNIAATTGTASGDFTFKGLTIEYLGGN